MICSSFDTLRCTVTYARIALILLNVNLCSTHLPFTTFPRRQSENNQFTFRYDDLVASPVFWHHPSGGAVLQAHSDEAEGRLSMSLQLVGKKTWRLRALPLVQYQKSQNGFSFAYESRLQSAALERADFRVVLEPGDAIFWPPGMIHETAGFSEARCSLSCSFRISGPVAGGQYYRTFSRSLGFSAADGKIMREIRRAELLRELKKKLEERPHSEEALYSPIGQIQKLSHEKEPSTDEALAVLDLKAELEFLSSPFKTPLVTTRPMQGGGDVWRRTEMAATWFKRNCDRSAEKWFQLLDRDASGFLTPLEVNEYDSNWAGGVVDFHDANGDFALDKAEILAAEAEWDTVKADVETWERKMFETRRAEYKRIGSAGGESEGFNSLDSSGLVVRSMVNGARMRKIIAEDASSIFSHSKNAKKEVREEL